MTTADKVTYSSPYARLHQASNWVNQNYLYLGRRVVALEPFVYSKDSYLQENLESHDNYRLIFEPYYQTTLRIASWFPIFALAHLIKKVDEFAWNREIKTAEFQKLLDEWKGKTSLSNSSKNFEDISLAFAKTEAAGIETGIPLSEIHTLYCRKNNETSNYIFGSEGSHPIEQARKGQIAMLTAIDRGANRALCFGYNFNTRSFRGSLGGSRNEFSPQFLTFGDKNDFDNKSNSSYPYLPNPLFLYLAAIKKGEELEIPRITIQDRIA